MGGARRERTPESELITELIRHSYEVYVDLKARGYIVNGEPRVIPQEDTGYLTHNEAYPTVRFFFGPGLEIALAMGSLHLDPDVIRQKLEPALWETLIHEYRRKPPGHPTKPSPG